MDHRVDDDDGRVDYLLIGAGPAGLQLGWFLQRAGRNYVVLEAGSTPGTFYRRFPRHRRMISINKPHTGWDDPELNLRMDWNSLLSDDPALVFTRYTDRYFPDADDYVRYLTDFAAACRLNVEYDTRVTRITRAGHQAGEEAGDFLVTDHRGRTRRARRVVVATGLGALNIPPIPGIEMAERYDDVSVDPDDFTDQRVAIIGKGNSAFETADNLIERAAVIHVIGPRSLTFAWRTHFIGHLRAVNNNFLDTYQLKTQNMVLDATVRGIERVGPELLLTLAYSRRDRTVRLAYDRVIACTGFRMDPSIFDAGCRPDTTIGDRFPALTAEWESVNVPDLYFAGTLTQSRDYRRHTSAFIHGFRYGARALQRMLDRRYEGVEWPHRRLPPDPDALADAVLARVNRSSALWQQYAFLCDLIELGPLVRYYEEVPVDHIVEGGFRAEGAYLTVTLEYGAGHDTIDPFDVEVGRAWEADPTHREDRYLHPVVRRYQAGQLVPVLHLPEDVCNDWSGDAAYRMPLRKVLGQVMAQQVKLT